MRSRDWRDRKSTRLNSSHLGISYAVFCLKKNAYVYSAPSSLLGPQTLLATLPRAAETAARGLGIAQRAGRPRVPTRVPAFRFFFNDRATTEIYTLSLHDALPI